MIVVINDEEMDFTLEEGARTVAAVFHLANGQVNPGEVGPNWLMAALAGLNTIQAADKMPWTDVARAMAKEFYAAVNEVKPFGGLPVQEQYAWEATARHLANFMADCEPGELPKHEVHWYKWVQDKMAELAKFEQDANHGASGGGDGGGQADTAQVVAPASG